MKDQANGVIKSIQQFWKSRTKKQHITYLSILGAIIILAIVLAMVLNKPSEYTVLYTNLDSSEAAEILTEIQAMEIDSKVESDGTIMVPKDQENALRMQLGTKGYPKSGFSYDIYADNVNMFTTDSQQREINKMQLQERMQATIETIEGVEQAIVTLDIPQTSNTVITTNTKESRASVVVHLEDGVTLLPAQVKGITRIVMMAVSGLEEENISVTDGMAKPLSFDEDEVSSVGRDAERLKYKLELEKTINDKILELLTPSYGFDGVKVSTNAVLNYDKKVTENTEYTPSVGEDGMPYHEEQSSSSSSETTEGEVVGVEPNADGTYPTEDGSETTASWQESNSSTDYYVNTLKQQTEKDGYSIEQISVAVTVYSSNMSDTEKSNIVQAVVNSAGTSEELVTVVNFPLLEDKPEEIEDEPADTEKLYFGYTKEQLTMILGIAAGVLLVIIVVLIIVIVKIRKKKKAKKKKLALEQVGIVTEGEEPGTPVDIKKLSGEMPETKEGAIRREIGDFAENSPEIVAQLLKTWIREDGDQ